MTLAPPVHDKYVSVVLAMRIVFVLLVFIDVARQLPSMINMAGRFASSSFITSHFPLTKNNSKACRTALV
jgi:hypothetical protein